MLRPPSGGREIWWSNMRGIVFLGALVVGMLMGAPVSGARSDEVRRDIQEFLEAERQCPPFLQNIDNVPFCAFRWWDPADGLGIWNDYAGVADDLLGGSMETQVSGSITERPLPDGRAQVTIRLHAVHALTFALPIDPAGPSSQFVSNPLYFGQRPVDVAEGATPSFGEAEYMIRFINTAPGAPIPALVPLYSFPEEGQEVIEIVYHSAARGELRELFGVPDGTPGRVQAAQTGLKMTSGGGSTADQYPAEDVRIFRTGN